MSTSKQRDRFMSPDRTPLDAPPCTVLLLEDEVDISAMLREALTEAGFPVIAAWSVGDALATLARQNVDAAILDVELRDGVAFPVADLLLKRHIPYVFASAVYQQAVPRAHQGAPFFAKPYEISQLITWMRRHQMAGPTAGEPVRHAS